MFSDRLLFNNGCLLKISICATQGLVSMKFTGIVRTKGSSRILVHRALTGAFTAVSCCTLILTQHAGPAAATAASEAEQIKAILTEYDGGQYESALKLCDSLLHANPRNLTAHYLKGNVCVKQNRLEQATAEYRYCITSGKGSTEANYAQTALTQIEQQEHTFPAVQAPSAVAPVAPSNGSTHSAEEYIKEESDRLLNEAKEKIEVKKKVLNDKVAQIHAEMKEQSPAFRTRGSAGLYYYREQIDQLQKDAAEKTTRLKEEFAREEEEINNYYQKRIDDLTEYRHNMDSRGSQTHAP
jgi:hypothetical protein